MRLQKFFCNTLLPDDEITIVRPPLDDIESGPNDFWILNKTLYGLRQSPQNWYRPIMNILREMGITPSKHDPCLFSGLIENSTTLAPPWHTIHVGLYVDNFVFFSEL